MLSQAHNEENNRGHKRKSPFCSSFAVKPLTVKTGGKW